MASLAPRIQRTSLPSPRKRMAASAITITATDAIVFCVRKMSRQFLLEIRINVARTEKAPNARDDRVEEGEHAQLPVSARSTLPMTPEMRSQFSDSAWSCFRPALVIE